MWLWHRRAVALPLTLLLTATASVVAQDIVFPDEATPAAGTAADAAAGAADAAFVNTTPIPAEVVTVALNESDAEAHIDAVHDILNRASETGGADPESPPDLSPSALGSRSVLPRQYSGCRAPTGETGDCGTVRQCPGIYRIRDATYLRGFLCGYSGQTPLVCCPTRWTSQYFYGYQRATTTRAPPLYNSGYGNYQSPYQSGRPYSNYNNNNNNNYPHSYSQPQYSTSQYAPYPRPVNNLHFSATTSPRPAQATTARQSRSTARPPQRQAEASSAANSRPDKPSFLPNKCGVGTGLSRIVGGTEATPGSYPWMAAIYYIQQGSWLQACGGALVSNLHVVTAAHCVVSGSRSQNLPPRVFLIRLGDHNLVSTDDLPEGVTKDVKVAKISRHSQFNQNTYKNDIALMELESPVTFSKFIQPVCLPYDGLHGSLENEIAVVTGWGYTKYEGKGSDVLKQAAIRIWPESECREAFKKEVTITSEYLCAGDGTGKKDSCQGDSGGPLVYNEGTKYYLIGIVSFGKKCATPGYPGAYTRVTKYLDWLNDHF